MDDWTDHTYSWRGGHNQPIDEKVTGMHLEDMGSTLVIHNVTALESYSEYSCHASNSRDRLSRKFYLELDKSSGKRERERFASNKKSECLRIIQ